MSASEYKEAMLKIFFDLNGQQQQDQQEELISKDENRRN